MIRGVFLVDKRRVSWSCSIRGMFLGLVGVVCRLCVSHVVCGVVCVCQMSSVVCVCHMRSGSVCLTCLVFLVLSWCVICRLGVVCGVWCVVCGVGVSLVLCQLMMLSGM